MEPGQPPAPLPPLPLTWARLTAGVGNRGWEQGLLRCSPLRVTACHPNPEADVPFSLLPVLLLSGGPEIQRPWDGSAWEAAVQVFTLTQNSCLENPRDGGAWWAAVRGVAKSRTRLSDFTFTHWRRQWHPTPVLLPGESLGRGSLVGCRLWGRTVGHD